MHDLIILCHLTFINIKMLDKKFYKINFAMSSDKKQN